MLDANLKSQLQGYLQRIDREVHIVAVVDDSATAHEMLALLGDIAGLSALMKVSQRQPANGELAPSFTVGRPGEAAGIRFAGVPLGHEFTSLVLALLQVGGYPSKESAGLLQQIAALPGEHQFETFISLSCQNCPDVVQALNLMAVLNPAIRHTMIDGAVFEQEVAARQIM